MNGACFGYFIDQFMNLIQKILRTEDLVICVLLSDVVLLCYLLTKEEFYLEFIGFHNSVICAFINGMSLWCL